MVRLRTLGTAELAGADAALARAVLAQPRRWALLVYLALATPRGFWRRDTLLALFWPDHPTGRARNALRQALHFLRHSLGADALVNRGQEDVGLVVARVACDAVEFEELLDGGRLADALELYRGDLLPGFFISDSPEFERWLDLERARLRDRAATAARQLAETELARGDSAGAAAFARRAASLAPDDQRGVQNLLQALDASGDVPAALRAYDAYAERLRQEFEVDPSPEIRGLVQAMRARHAAAPAVPPPSPLTSRVPPPTRQRAAENVPSALAPQVARDRLAVARRALLTGAGLAVVVALLVAGRLFQSALLPAVGDARDAVAVLPFPVRGRPELGYLRDGMVDVLSAKLESAAGLRSIDPPAVLGAVARTDSAEPLDPVRASAIARQLGAGRYVLGDVVEIAGRVHIGGALYQRGRATPSASASVEGDADRLFDLLDDLAARLLAGQGSGRDMALVRLSAVTTKSLSALKAYLEGEAAFRAGQDSRAWDAFQRAVAEDSTFALAHYRVATVAPWAGTQAARDRAIREATQYGDRLPPLVRRLLAGYRAYAGGDGATAEDVYRAITVTRPDNVEAWFMLGETLFHFNTVRGRPAGAARDPFERVLALQPYEPHALIHLARLAAVEGRNADLEVLVRRYLERYGETPLAIEMRALQAFAVGDTLEQASVRAALARTTDHALFTTLTSIALRSGRLTVAASLIPLHASPGRDPAFYQSAHLLDAQFGLAAGMWRATAPEPGPLVAVAPRWRLETRALFAAGSFSRLPRSALTALRDTLTRSSHAGVVAGLFAYEAEHDAEVRSYMAGLLSARLADSTAALAYAAALDRLANGPGHNELGRDLAHGVRAQLAWARGAPQAANDELRQIRFDAPLSRDRPVFFGMHERFLRAELLHAAGRDVEALDWYESSGDERDLIHLAPSHLRRAQIYERMGKRAEATLHYSRFVTLWQDCDPELRPMVDEARRALSRLAHIP